MFRTPSVPAFPGIYRKIYFYFLGCLPLSFLDFLSFLEGFSCSPLSFFGRLGAQHHQGSSCHSTSWHSCAGILWKTIGGRRRTIINISKRQMETCIYSGSPDFVFCSRGLCAPHRFHQNTLGINLFWYNLKLSEYLHFTIIFSPILSEGRKSCLFHLCFGVRVPPGIWNNNL